MPLSLVEEVPILGGTKKLPVRPWTMAQQDEIMPLVAALVDEYMGLQESTEEFSIGSLVVRFQSEISVICQRTVHADLEVLGLQWAELYGEDLFGIAQAVWSTSILRPGGGGVLGKAIVALGPSLTRLLQKSQDAKSSGTSAQNAA
jgi:hypothetical protein